MPAQADTTLTLPSEYFDALSAVIETGLKHAGINPLIRRELAAWWEAESELIRDDLSSKEQ